jgi:hypothetical protein
MHASSVKHTQLRGLQGSARGFFRMLVFVGYVACLVLALTGMYIAASESLLAQKRSSRIFAMETFFAASPVAVLACVTAHAVLYSLTIVIAWTYKSYSFLAVALGNLVATCGMLLLPQRTVHFTLATTAAVTRALLHGTVSASVVGFLWYRVVVAVSNCTFVAYAALWALTEVIAVIFMLCHTPLVGTATFNTLDLLGGLVVWQGEYAGKHTLHAAAFSVQFFVWGCIAVEHMCLVSVLHGSQHASHVPVDAAAQIFVRADGRRFRTVCAHAATTPKTALPD